MKDSSRTWGEEWLAAQRALWQAWLPVVPAQADAERSATPGAALEEQFNDLRDTWQASLAKWSEFAREALPQDVASADQLREIFTPAAWARFGSDGFDLALRRVLEGPRYALLWDLDRKLLELQRLTLQRDKDVAAYQAVMQRAWSLVFERFAKAISEASGEPGKRTWRGLLDRWLAIANDTLTEVYRSDEFLEAQRRMLRSASDRHVQEREIAEAWCEAAHMPTRSEVDELQRQLIELRREVRLMRRSAQGSGDRAAAVRPATKKAASKRARA